MDNGRRGWKKLPVDYQQPPLDPAIDAELRDYMARRKAGSGVAS